MKILEINSVCGIRSTGRICTDLADVLHENGHECRIAYGRESAPEKYKNISYRIGSDMDVNIHALKARIFDCVGFGSKKATKKLIEQIREYNPDIIHLHNIHGYYLDIEILFQYLASVDTPVIWTLHDCWAFTGHCAHFSVVHCDRWKNGCYKCPQKKEYPSSLGIDRSRVNWNTKKKLFTSVKNMTIVTPSEWLARLVKDSFLGKYDVQVIPNGVDLEEFKPVDSNFRTKYHLENKKIILGVATAWSERKGLDEFKKLSQILDEEYKIVLLGLNHKQINELPAKIIGLPVTNTVGELAELYATADIFLNLSREETMGLTTIEAMACGTLVVVSNCTAVPEVVESNSGIILDDLNIETIKTAIEKAEALELQPRYSVEKYEKKNQYLKYLELYNEQC